MGAGIYQIMNMTDKKRYIGSAVDIDKRWRSHKNALNKGIHHNKYLQRAWNKYGKENFLFEIIAICDNEVLIEQEQHYFDKLKPEYNVLRIAGSVKGYKHTEEAKRKISCANAISLKDRIIPEETRRKMSISKTGEKNSFYGKKHSEETKIKIGLSGLGRPRPDLTNRISPLKGRKLSEERKQRLRESWIKRRENKKI